MKYTRFIWIVLSITLSCQTLSAQELVYRDTSKISSSRTGSRTEVSVKSYKPIARSNRKNSIPTEFIFTQVKKKIYLPEDFRPGFDSTFFKTVTHPEFYLTSVWAHEDNKGNSTLEEFHPSGTLKSVWTFKGKGLQEIIRIDSMKEISLSEDQVRYEKLAKSDWKRDTFYSYQAVLHGQINSWYEDGTLAKVASYNMGEIDDTLKVYYPNGTLAHTSFCKSGTLFSRPKILLTASERAAPFNREELEQDCSITYWYPNGNKKAEVHQVSYDKIGKQFYWYENGNPKSRYHLFNEDTLGLYEEFHPNGKPKIRGYYDTIPMFETRQEFIAYWDQKSKKVGKPLMRELDENNFEFLFSMNGYTYKQGTFEYFGADGQRLFSSDYEAGILLSTKNKASKKELEAFHFPPEEMDCYKKISFRLPEESRRFQREVCIGNITGSRTDTFEIQAYAPDSDSLQTFTEIIHFQNPYGKSTYECYYPNGKLQMRLHFDERESLKKSAKESFKEGMIYTSSVPEIGTSTYYYPNGRVKWEKTYFKYALTNRSELIEEKTYYKNGHLASEKHLGYQALNAMATGIYKEGPRREYYENGFMKWECTYINGKKDGSEKFWHVHGELSKHLNYRAGDLHDWQYFYDDEGKLVRKEYYVLGKLKKKKDY